MSIERGLWSITGSSAISSVASRLGFDWLCLDAQHGSYDDAALRSALAGRRDDSVPVWVRVRSGDASLIGRALDAGAVGIIVPVVDSPEQAVDIAAATRYPPLGRRSWGPYLADRIDAPPPEVANERVRLAVMIETATALDAVELIAAVEGVDMLFVGPFDLAIALGMELEALLSDRSVLPRIVEAAARAGIAAGAFAGTPERALRLAALGFTTVAVATDVVLLERGATAVLAVE